MSDPCGRQIMAELYQCNPAVLQDFSGLKEIVMTGTSLAGAEIREVAFSQLDSTRISGVVLIDDAHLAIHTFAQQSYASLDIYSFNQRFNPNEAYNYIANQLQASWTLVKELYRGCGEILERCLSTGPEQTGVQIAKRNPAAAEAQAKPVPNLE